MYRRGFKRILDILAASLLIMISLPITILAAIAVYFTMGKPLFFRQRRPGLNERPFELMKFRTMNDHCDSQGRLLPERARLTFVGRWLRKLSIDEIPQLWNVLKGEMSIIGPRPLLMEYLPYYSPRERMRHTVRPGITGLSQVSGRNLLDWDARLALDVSYVENLGFTIDLKIILKTIRQVMSGADVKIVPGSVVSPLNVFRAGNPRSLHLALSTITPTKTMHKGTAMYISMLKRTFLCLFSRFNPGDITVKHYMTGERFHLHSFYHRSYWFHGKHREADTMQMFARLISPGSCIIDIGGHIGYVAQYFSSLAGSNGSVYVFEPAPNNLHYLQKNVANNPNITLVPKAVGSANGRKKMFVESITGQNCSFLYDYVVRRNAERSGMAGPKVYDTEVDVVALDGFVLDANVSPDFVKIDVEGFEWEVLQGAARTLDRVKPMLMVEMRANKERVLTHLTQKGYVVFDPQMKMINDVEECEGNVFCLHEKAHGSALRRFARIAA